MATIDNITAPADTDRAVAALTLAFSTDPAGRWLYGGDPHLYLAHFPAFVRAFGGRAFEAGSARAIEGGIGAALWLPPGIHVDDEELGAVLERTVAPERLSVIGAVFEQMARYHPDGPHWYLPLIGVDSRHQQQGHGSALLEHTLRQCDRDRTAAYLEATNPRNLSLYERHGFEILGTIAVDSSCSISPMLRLPR